MSSVRVLLLVKDFIVPQVGILSLVGVLLFILKCWHMFKKPLIFKNNFFVK